MRSKRRRWRHLQHKKLQIHFFLDHFDKLWLPTKRRRAKSIFSRNVLGYSNLYLSRNDVNADKHPANDTYSILVDHLKPILKFFDFNSWSLRSMYAIHWQYEAVFHNGEEPFQRYNGVLLMWSYPHQYILLPQVLFTKMDLFIKYNCSF